MCFRPGKMGHRVGFGLAIVPKGRPIRTDGLPKAPKENPVAKAGAASFTCQKGPPRKDQHGDPRYRPLQLVGQGVGATYSANSNAAFPRSSPSFSTGLIDRRLDSSVGLAHHLDALRRIAADGQSVPLGGTPAPTWNRRFQVRGANGTAIDDHERQWRADAVINGGSKTV
jgi:hypothetical protein